MPILAGSSLPMASHFLILHGPPDLARPAVQHSMTGSSQPVSYEKDATDVTQLGSNEKNAVDDSKAAENLDSGDEPQAPSADGVTEEDLAESRALEEQLRAEVESARSDVFNTLKALSELQNRCKVQFLHLQEAIASKLPERERHFG